MSISRYRRKWNAVPKGSKLHIKVGTAGDEAHKLARTPPENILVVDTERNGEGMQFGPNVTPLRSAHHKTYLKGRTIELNTAGVYNIGFYVYYSGAIEEVNFDARVITWLTHNGIAIPDKTLKSINMDEQNYVHHITIKIYVE